MGSDPTRGGPEDEDEEGVVRPDDLDFTRDERVVTMQDDRFVIATGSGAPTPLPEETDTENEEKDSAGRADTDEPTDTDEATTDTETPEPGSIQGADARELLASHVASVGSDHGFSITASFDGRLAQHEVFSNDLDRVFGELLTWYATRVDDDSDPAEVLGILLLASDRQVTFPRRALVDVFRSHGLSPDDTVGDLLHVLGEDGLTLPAEE